MPDGMGIFRRVNRGDVEMEVNSRPMVCDRYVDTSRIREQYTEQYIPSDTPGKYGKWEGRTTRESLMDAARAGADAMKHRSAFKDTTKECDPSTNVATPWGFNDSGPLVRRRGDDY